MTISGLKKRIWIFCINHIYAGTRWYEKKRALMRKLGHEVGEGTKIVGPIFCTGNLSIGKNCWIGKNLIVNGNGAVVIGDNCDIAPEVTFLTGGHEIGDAKRRAGKGETYTIEVGKGTWIGARATIGRSIEIGNGCVIAACSCVMKNVEDNRVVGGVPAKEIKILDDKEISVE